MPRGRGGKSHKGKTRHFTSPEELEAHKKKTEREKQWREQKGELSSSDSEDEGATGKNKVSSSESEESSSENEQTKVKGIEHLIEVENPNRAVKKKPLKSESYVTEEAPQLSRREREEIEHQKAKANYMKLHAAGKTQEAQSDLARLALIRKQREEAAKKRDEARKVKESTKAGK
ncbi:28 kDa heat- and acid-stable phosphoprotein-like [Limulus polyphemus]|uniref:28 kDa heat- and acid-stable phosphoprotein-like n=1 Tax=Limulus polyphemus TaxID=6850 RepID=A0ABM1B1I9_LIMPO|nr:28 kDa heat- and acid-stable phosphoprotein-like [Limulus polyphemus]